MASQGPRYPGTAASLSVASTLENKDAWVNPANVGADDGTESTITAATFDSPDISQILVASNFGFTIPTGATIDGIVVEIDRRNSAGAASDNRVQLATGTTFADLVGNNKADTALDWPTATAVATYGGAADLWAAGLTVAQINATGFAVFLSAQADAANTDIQVDYIRVTVDYTPLPDTALAGSSAGVATAAAVLTVPGDNAYEDAVFADSPVAVWSMEEASGNLTDLIAAAVATAAGGPTYGATGPVAGKTAITFDNVDDAFNAGDLAVADFGTGSFAAEGWFKTTDTNYGFIVGKKGDTGSGAGWQIGLDNAAQFRFECSNGTTYNVYTPSSAGYRDGNWHHIVATRDSGTMRVYVDGTQLGSGLASSVDVSTALDLRIGRTGEASTFWNGDLGYIALYGTALSATRITAHYDAATGADTALAGSSAGVATAAGVLTTQIRPAGVSDGAATAAGILTTQIRPAGVSAGAATALASLTTAIRPAGVSAGAATADGILTTAIPLIGASAGSSSAVAVFPILLIGSSAGSATAEAVLTTAIPLDGAAAGSASATADLTIGADQLIGSSVGVATVAAALTTQIRIGGASAGAATAVGALTTQVTLLATAGGSGAAAGVLATSITLGGASTGSAAAAGSLATAIPFLGTSAGSATATGSLATSIALVATAAGAGTVGAVLTTTITLAGSSDGAATAAGTLPGSAASLSGSAAGSATAAAALTTLIRLVSEATGTGAASADLVTAISLGGSATASSTSGAGLTTVITLAGSIGGTAGAAGVLTIPILLSGTAAGVATASGSLATPAERGSVGAAAQPRDSTGIAAVLRDTVVIAHGPGSSSGALAQPTGSVVAAHNLRDTVGAEDG